MVLLNQCVVPFAEDLPRFVADDHAANRTAALVVSLFCQQDGDAHEVPVRQLLEEPVFDDLGKALGREMSDRVQNLLGNRSILRNKGLHESSFRDSDASSVKGFV